MSSGNDRASPDVRKTHAHPLALQPLQSVALAFIRHGVCPRAQTAIPLIVSSDHAIDELGQNDYSEADDDVKVL
jgi:hypothetical protein